MRGRSVNLGFAAAALLMMAALAWLFMLVPAEDGVREWTGSLNPGGWMAWTFPVALFFWCIGALLVLFTILAIRFPETPRKGILGIETTRGDRLFITLLGSAFICLASLFFGLPLLWWGIGICLVWALAVFRLV